jgi:ATP dependent DNA ligase C terminal region
MSDSNIASNFSISLRHARTFFPANYAICIFRRFNVLQQIRFYNLPAAGRNRWDQGLTAAEMKRCHWVKPESVCQIKFTEWTRDDRLRQPVLLGIREDKNENEVVREKAS